MRVEGLDMKVNDFPERKTFLIRILATIYFDHNSHQLSGQTMALLDNLLNSTRGKDIIGVNITGYTDSDGEADYNMSLSKLRVTTARRYMLNQGIGQEKVKSSWFGEEKAIASNDTEKGK